ncbi:MAG TPA: cytochrome c biogenesis protein CcsA [Candidatus Hydrogenedentes bacterium]|nr:cytochrome c biogenesis protein CcsA [Candidatus Hydrogenedentota bacterium]HRK35055.1 cytochrome c biogenesis protein CcsA [Candidatus Hydrogenedentota bacterium]
MTLAIDITFLVAVCLYVVAAVMSYVYLQGGKNSVLRATHHAVVGGAVLLFLLFCMRWATHGRLPLTTMVDVLNILILTATAVVLPLVRRENVRALLCYYAPPLALLAVFNGIVGRASLRTVPKELNEAFVAMHVGPVIIAFALFFVASLTGFVYIVQAQRLKSLRTNATPAKLPPLEQLDATLFSLIRWGYPLFVVTLLLGFFGAYLFPEELDANWWRSPKILLAVATAALFSFSFHSRKLGLLRGRKLAYVVVVGFTVMLAIYLLLQSTGLKDYGFWSASV